MPVTGAWRARVFLTSRSQPPKPDRLCVNDSHGSD